MFSFNNYQEQCYNPGSPSPNPLRPPLQELPKINTKDSLVNSFEFPPNSPTKITTRQTKRKGKDQLENCLLKTPTKKPKTMKEEELRAFLTGISSKMDQFTAQLSSHTEQSAKTEQKLATLTDTFANFKETLENSNKSLEKKIEGLEVEFSKIQDTVENSAAKITEEVKSTIVPFIQDEIAPKMKSEIKSEVLKAVDASWKLQLAKENRENDCCAIVFGLPVQTSPKNDASNFLKNDLKMNEETLEKISLKQTSRLGKGKGDRPPPLLLTFSHPSDRSLVFSHSKNLKNTKISLEKQIPKLYQNEYKNFKNLAHKLRNMPDMNYQTDISFDGHLMQLRYKKRDTPGQKYHYIIHSEYFPPVEKASSELKSSTYVPPGTIATPVISAELMSKANCSFFMTGMTIERTEDTFRQLLLEHVNLEDRDSVIDVKLNRTNTAVIYCRTWEDCNKIVSSKKDAKFQNEKVFLSMFTDKKPENS